MIDKKGRPTSIWRRITCKLGFHSLYEHYRKDIIGCGTLVTNTCRFCYYSETELKDRKGEIVKWK